jgi:hypothetical protein
LYRAQQRLLRAHQIALEVPSARFDQQQSRIGCVIGLRADRDAARIAITASQKQVARKHDRFLRAGVRAGLRTEAQKPRIEVMRVCAGTHARMHSTKRLTL